VLEGRADAVLAASIFHFGEFTVREAKEYIGKARNRNQAFESADAMAEEWLDRVKWDEQGLVPAIPRKVSTDKVLTLA